MNRKQIDETFRETLFMIRDSNSVTLSGRMKDDLEEALEGARALLDKGYAPKERWPKNLLLEIGIYPPKESIKQISENLYSVLDKISDTEKEMLQMKYQYDASNESIAKAIGISEESVSGIMADTIDYLSEDTTKAMILLGEDAVTDNERIMNEYRIKKP